MNGTVRLPAARVATGNPSNGGASRPPAAPMSPSMMSKCVVCDGRGCEFCPAAKTPGRPPACTCGDRGVCTVCVLASLAARPA
jgi:hypothetical protein